MLILVLSLIFLLVKMNFILVNVSLDKAIIFLIHFSHLASGVILKLKYLKILDSSLFYFFPFCINKC